MSEIRDRWVAARKALRHAAHVYVTTSRSNVAAHDEAGERLDRAALLLALTAAEWGLVADHTAKEGEQDA